MAEKRNYLFLCLIGVILQGICILGACIAATSDVSLYYDIKKTLIIPNVFSYILIIWGIVAEFNLVSIIKNIQNHK